MCAKYKTKLIYDANIPFRSPHSKSRVYLALWKLKRAVSSLLLNFAKYCFQLKGQWDENWWTHYCRSSHCEAQFSLPMALWLGLSPF